jgi:hypothetical protein
MAKVTLKAITGLPHTANTDRVKSMLQALRHAHQLTRFVLVWFALSLGVAMASPLVSPKSMDMVCTSGGVIKWVVSDEGDQAQPASASMDCPCACPWPFRPERLPCKL